MALQYLILQDIIDDDIDLNIIFYGANQLVNNPNIIPPERAEPARNKNYYELVVPYYTLDDFKSHFRMSRATFEVLRNEVIALRNNNQQEIIPFDKKLLFTIWVISKQESFKSVGDRFDMAPSTAHNIFFETISLIANLRHTQIVWPNEQEGQHIIRTLQNRSGIPGVIGLIDGCHIPIKAPPHNAMDFYNRNNYHSVVLQGVFNHHREFIDIFVGIPGRVHDARVFRLSPLYNVLTSGAPHILENEHLLGDAAYPLRKFLLKPYRDNGHLRNNQIRFNTVMSSIRVRIEQCFGILKGRFRRLKYLDMCVLGMIPTVVTAACVLHNIISRHDTPDDNEDWLIDDPDQIEDDIEMDIMNFAEQIERNDAGERKRDYIASLL